MKHVSLDAAVAFDAAARRHGLIVRSEAIALGLTAQMIRTRLEKGRWIAVGRGLYRIAGMPMTWEQRVLAACLLGGPGSVASHHSAGVLWGLSGIRPGSTEITIRHGANGERARQLGRVHWSRRLDQADLTTLHHIPVTNALRTVVDLAGCVSEDALTEVVDDVVCRKIVSIDDLSQLKKGRRGPKPPRLLEVLAKWECGPPPDSIAEMRLERSIIAHGLPKPVRQHEVWTDGTFVARLDLAWPAVHLGLELQSLRRHSAPAQFHADRKRILALRACGWDIVEITPRLLQEEGGLSLCNIIRAELSRIGHLGS